MAELQSTPATGQPVTFRAGRGPAENALPGAADHATAEAAAAASPAVYLADISEFQPSISDAAYLAWSQAIVIRAAYGASHADHAWYGGQRRALLLQGGAKFLGIYQYLVASQDPVAQAKALVSILGGKLNTGEKIICDIEEGGGSQAARWSSWAHVISTELGDPPWNYSGLFFAGSAGIAPVDWVAAYQRTEPSTKHTLWQFTDAFAVPGVGTCDCSVYHGTIGQLAALAHGGSQPAPPPAQSWTEQLIGSLPTVSAGAAGQDPRSVQGLLCAGGHTVGIDGAYGPVTRSAVMAFQHSAGITPDGVTGQGTWHQLLLITSPGQPLPVLSPGMTGKYVRSVQGLLCARGYPTAIDGAYGPATTRNVTALQHARGITADGITGQQTWTKLLNR